jgi:hypothetical protein
MPSRHELRVQRVVQLSRKHLLAFSAHQVVRRCRIDSLRLLPVAAVASSEMLPVNSRATISPPSLGRQESQRLGRSHAFTASRLFVNFFQPSFKLAAKRRDGAQVFKRYHSPQTPCERLLQADSVPTAAKDLLREISVQLPPRPKARRRRSQNPLTVPIVATPITPAVT